MKEPDTSFRVVAVGNVFMVVLAQGGRWNVPVANHPSEGLAKAHVDFLNAALSFPDVTLEAHPAKDIHAISCDLDDDCACIRHGELIWKD